MSTCYERLRKKETFEDYKRLSEYFRAIDDDKVDEYHDRHNRKLKKWNHVPYLNK